MGKVASVAFDNARAVGSLYTNAFNAAVEREELESTAIPPWIPLWIVVAWCRHLSRIQPFATTANTTKNHLFASCSKLVERHQRGSIFFKNRGDARPSGAATPSSTDPSPPHPAAGTDGTVSLLQLDPPHSTMRSDGFAQAGASVVDAGVPPLDSQTGGGLAGASFTFGASRVATEADPSGGPAGPPTLSGSGLAGGPATNEESAVAKT